MVDGSKSPRTAQMQQRESGIWLYAPHPDEGRRLWQISPMAQEGTAMAAEDDEINSPSNISRMGRAQSTMRKCSGSSTWESSDLFRPTQNVLG